jgi:hypothetical protein
LHLGFTGSQLGGTADQLRDLAGLLLVMRTDETDYFHHGDCIGADAQAHDLAKAAGWKVIIHPPEDPSKRAFCNGDLVHEPRPYLERNRDIVNATEALIAVPKDPETLRSGTWSTVRYARKHGRHIIIIEPTPTEEDS